MRRRGGRRAGTERPGKAGHGGVRRMGAWGQGWGGVCAGHVGIRPNPDPNPPPTGTMTRSEGS